MEIWFKQKSRTRMKCEWTGRTISKKKIRSKKTEKTVKINVPHLIKKPLGRKQIFIQTPFSHYFKIRLK